VVLTSESVDEILSVTIQMKATEEYFPDRRSDKPLSAINTDQCRAL